MLKRLICIFFWFRPPIFIQNERTESRYYWKRAHHCYKSAPLFDKRALGQSRRTSGGLIPLTGICFWHILFKLKNFFQKGSLLKKRPIPGCFILLKKPCFCHIRYKLWPPNFSQRLMSSAQRKWSFILLTVTSSWEIMTW